MAVQDLLHSETGGIIISIILGLGLAAMFKRVCKGNNCVVIKGPPVNDVNKYYYKIQDDCFKYTPYVVPCDDNQEAVKTA